MTTQEKLANAVKDVDGDKESILIIHCQHKKQQCLIGWVGDMEQIAGAIATKLEKLPEAIEKNERGDVAFALCILQAIAASDYRTDGLVLDMIKEVKEQNIQQANSYAN